MEKAIELRDLLRVAKPKPLMGEDFDKFHVDTTEARGRDSASILTDYFEVNMDEPQKVLFMGHQGSGKSTELWKVTKNLEPHFWAVSFSIMDEVDHTDLNYVDLIFTILDNIMARAQEHGIDIEEHILDNLYSYWHDEHLMHTLNFEKVEIAATVEAKVGFLTAIRAKVKGVLSTGRETKKSVRKIIEPKLSQLVRGTNDLLTIIREALKKEGKVPIVIIEDLDKLNIPVAEDLFLNHRDILTDLHVHTIYTFPIFLRYSGKFSEINSSFDKNELLSMIKVSNKDGSPNGTGISIIQEIVERRAEPKLFEKDALRFIIEKSGGYLRDVFSVMLEAALIVRSKDRNAGFVTFESSRMAYRGIKNDFERFIGAEHLSELKKLYDDPAKKPLPNQILMELLDRMAVIEYNGDMWCGIHPAVQEIIHDKIKAGTLG
ncbi:MAG: hypothetical protein HZC51_09090 [Nitrospirae bacterium]|nr:hypothetical protein [Nitrospirota bacterium]